MHSVIASVSSDHSAPLSVTAPSPSAASTIARFVIELRPCGIAIAAGLTDVADEFLGGERDDLDQLGQRRGWWWQCCCRCWSCC